MDAPQDISMKTEEVLRVELEVLRHEHRDLDDAIDALHTRGVVDALTLQRLKKKKLFINEAALPGLIEVLRDEISDELHG